MKDGEGMAFASFMVSLIVLILVVGFIVFGIGQRLEGIDTNVDELREAVCQGDFPNQKDYADCVKELR